MSDPASSLSLWESVLNELKSLFPADLFEMWFDDLKCVEQGDDRIILEAPNDFNAIWVENNYADIIAQQAYTLSGMPVTVEVRAAVAASTRADAADASSRAAGVPTGTDGPANNGIRGTDGRGHVPATSDRQRRTIDPARLNPRNTFENFVVGSGNQLAHAASIAVANAPGRAYNPLFVYGETGLGKTHLMHAVAHQMLNNNPSAHIAYVSTEKFTNEFIRAIQENKLSKFRKYYRNVDALLVDDIHFLSGKESTQEEFFHIFNALHQEGKQIILSSDRAPKDVPDIEERLISRFSWGLSADLQIPEFETRYAILERKSADNGITIDPKVLEFIAHNFKSNVRDLEGAIIKLLATASLKQVDEMHRFLLNTSYQAIEINHLLKKKNSAAVTQSDKLHKVLARPNITREDLIQLNTVASFIESNKISDLAFEQAEIQTKYQGYIDKEIALADKMKRLDTVKIPKAYDYSCLASLSHEAKEKLTAIQPTNLAQASRISGINPSDIAVLLVQLSR